MEALAAELSGTVKAAAPEADAAAADDDDDDDDAAAAAAAADGAALVFARTARALMCMDHGGCEWYVRTP
jgi:hypothetical protein